MQEPASWTERQAAELNARISRLMAGAPVTEADAQVAARRAVEAKALLVATKKRFSDFLERAAIIYRFPPSADALDEPGGYRPVPGQGRSVGRARAGKTVYATAVGPRRRSLLGAAQPRSEVVTALEAWVRRGLREYAVALRKLAYSLPNGVGEWELLQLSEQMNTAASQDLGGIFASVGLKDPLVLEKRIE